MTITQPEEKSLRACLAYCFDLLPEAQQRAAAWFLAEGSKYTGCNLADVVTMAKVSPTAVIRMCQTLGLRGYREFRLRWALEETGSGRAVADAADAFRPAYQAIQETEALLDLNAVAYAAQMIVDAKQVFIYGSGSSGLVARLAAVSFSWTGLRSTVISDNQLRSEPTYSEHMYNESNSTAVLVVSHRGYWPEVMARLDNNRKNGAKVIVLTSAPHSELAGCADILLVTGCPTPPCEDNRLLALSAARVAQTTAVHILAEAIRRVKVGE